MSLFFLQFYYSQEARSPFFYSENGEEHNLDTSSLFNFHEYRIDNEYVWLGNNGQAQYSLVYDAEKETKYYVSQLLNSVKEFNYKKYNVKVPFTSVKFVQGARLEQYFNLLHTQNFAKSGNFSLSYDKISSDGSYLRQKTNNNKLNATIWYKTPNDNYAVSFIANRVQNTVEQNGGLEDDSLFIFDSVFSTNRKTLNVNLDAASDQKIANQLALFQKFKLFGKIDSLGFGVTQNIKVKSSFTNSKRFYTDEDLNSEFYNNIYLDSTETNDSILLNEINQQFTYDFKLVKRGFYLRLAPRIDYHYTDYKQAGDHIWFNELSSGINADFENSKFSLETKTDFYFSGYRRGDYYNKNKIKFNLTKSLEWYLSGSINKYSPSLDLLKYYGNHTIWNNNFVSTESFSFSTGTNNNKWNVLASLTYTDIKNPIYFNYLALAKQSLDYTQIIQGVLEKKFVLKKWQLTPKLVYQYTGGLLVYRLPNYFTSLKIGYGFNAFKKKLAVFTGIKVSYYDKTQLMSYSSSLGQFYLGSNSEKVIGSYPFLDFFVNARIKDVRLFFALTHANQGLVGESNYFGAVNHPLEDRAYKVGISWNFKN